jgi:hypothetical protein
MIGQEHIGVSPPTMAPTIVELVLLSADGDGLRFRTASGELNPGGHPDRLALALSGLDLGEPAGLIHSTSWRFQVDRMVVTYAALPDPAPDHTARPLTGARLATSDDPLAPSPEQVDPGAVAVHACRHLAYLRHTDALVAARASAAARLWSLIGTFRPTVAGRLPHLSPVYSVGAKHSMQLL